MTTAPGTTARIASRTAGAIAVGFDSARITMSMVGSQLAKKTLAVPLRARAPADACSRRCPRRSRFVVAFRGAFLEAPANRVGRAEVALRKSVVDDSHLRDPLPVREITPSERHSHDFEKAGGDVFRVHESTCGIARRHGAAALDGDDFLRILRGQKACDRRRPTTLGRRPIRLAISPISISPGGASQVKRGKED